MSDSLSNDTLVQLRLGHLQMIQSVIARLSGYSAVCKNFCVTLAGAGVFINVAENGTGWIPLVFIGIILFAALDLYYLRLERAFRNTYKTVASRPLSQAPDLAIDKGEIDTDAWKSFSIWGFYVPQIVLVAVLFYCGDWVK